MPNDRAHRYDAVPPIPSYDEAIANTGPAQWSASPTDERHHSESQSLLFSNENVPSSSARRGGYRQPTVESDDELSLLGSDDDGDERYVRGEMQELEIGEPDRGSRSLWGKRMPFSLSLPRFQFSWLPGLRRTIRLPSGPNSAPSSGAEAATANGDSEAQTTPRPRFTWPKINFENFNGRMVALVIARVVAITIVLGFLYVVFVSDVFDAMARRFGTGLRFNPDEVRRWVQGHIEPKGMQACVRIYNEYAHLAGTEGDYALALDMQAMFDKARMETIHIEEFYAYLNYPKADGRAVEILDKDNKAKWRAKIEETDPHTEKEGVQTKAFHAHSKAGDVQGPLIYANYGSREDFAALKEAGVKTKGAIALVRYYGTQNDPALKVKAAELAGFAGCLIYSDPADDGFRKGDVAPNGRFMPQDGVHRSSVALSNWVLGDVLTPGWSSSKGAPRMKPSQSPGLNQIPSLPLAWRDAKVLLQHLKGKGSKAPNDWQGGVPDVNEWWTGDETSPVVRLKNDQDEEKKQPIWNVYGKINGIEQREKSIIIGNPRDSLAFGATGPHSGTAVMVELARVFGMLLDKGWRPLRNIEFMSWDGSQYNRIGSTEYVEANTERLKRDAFAYINLDDAVWGNELHVSGSPVFRNAIARAMAHVDDPFLNKTLHQLWQDRGGEIEPLNDITGDWAAFQNIAGTNSINLEFRGDPYPKDSSYNNFDWVDRVADPGFVYHGMMAQLVAVLVLELADRPIVPFDIAGYTQKMDTWADQLNDWLKAKMEASDGPADVPSLATDQLKIAIHEIRNVAKSFQEWEMTWDSIVLSQGGWESANLNVQRLGYNNQMALFETALIDPTDQGGITDRKQFKHSIFGPPAWPGSNDEFFPIIRAAAEAGDWKEVDRRILETCNWLRNAAKILTQDSASMIDE